MDSDYKPDSPVREVKFDSDEYYRLMAEKPGLAKYFSVSDKLIVSYQGVNYKIIE